MTEKTKPQMENTMMKNLNNATRGYFALVAFLLFVAISDVQGMPGWMHLAGADDLIGIPVSEGGVGDFTTGGIKSVMDYIDFPSRQIGKYHVNVTGGKILTPFNHADLRHNPFSVANVWHDLTGRVANVVRLHKIQDVAYNAVGKVSVDGWTITENMQKQAKDILTHVKKGKGLPKHLPRWVDNKGPNMVGKTLKVTSTNASAAPKGAVRNVATASMKTAYIVTGIVVAVDGGMTLYRINNIQDKYYAEQITEEEYILGVSRETGGFVGRTAGLVASEMLFTALTPFGPVGWVVGACATPVIIWGCEAAGEYIGELVGKGIIAWKKYQFEQDYAAYKDTMDFVLDPAVPPELFDELVDSKAFQAAYRNCWNKRTAENPHWTETTLSLDFAPVGMPSQTTILRDAFVD